VAQDVLIYVEHENDAPKRTGLEAATKASQLAAESGGRVHAVLLGAGARAAAERLAQYGADELHVSEDDVFDEFLLLPQVEVLQSLIESEGVPNVVLADTADSKDIASRLAVRLGAGLVSAVVDLSEHDGHLDAAETIFGGTYTTNVETQNTSISVYLVRPNAFTPQENPKQANVRKISYTLSDKARRVIRGQKVEEEGASIPLEEASIIVSGGRGLGGPEPFALLEELARELGGVVGASRAAVDAGWIPYAHQVGQTGRTVKPQLYIAIGISGAVQHRVGMQTADTVIAINRAEDAPIFQLADLAVVGDLFKVVPALTAELRRRKGE
jgi:electron transfer flavoprotein alpha subunit